MNQLKESFKKLNKEEKQKKLYSFLDKIDHGDETIHKIKTLLEKGTTISESFLIETYFDLLDFANALKESNKKKAISHLKATQDRLKNLTKIENEEHANAEQILGKIE